MHWLDCQKLNQSGRFVDHVKKLPQCSPLIKLEHVRLAAERERGASLFFELPPSEEMNFALLMPRITVCSASFLNYSSREYSAERDRSDDRDSWRAMTSILSDPSEHDPSKSSREKRSFSGLYLSSSWMVNCSMMFQQWSTMNQWLSESFVQACSLVVV